MKDWLRKGVVLLVIAAFAGGLAVVSGVVPISARGGHWAITAWFLDFVKRRSVATHAAGIHVPDLERADSIVAGAGHFHRACAPCHGSPELQYPAVPQHMTPSPPSLQTEVPNWEPEELFYIVKHGIKFTGMPAWPAADRDDEVWAVVAFMQRLPEMDPAEYRRLVYQGSEGELSAVPIAGLGEEPAEAVELAESCLACHGSGDEGQGTGTIPRLAGQRAEYLVASLRAYAAGERQSGIMKPVARGLSSSEIEQLALYFSAQRATSPRDADQPADLPQADGSAPAITRGAEIAQRGVPSDNVPSCVDCHRPTPDSAKPSRNPHYPLLAGQNAEYLALQLKLFQNRARGGSDYAHIMHRVADRLSAEQIEDVAAYFASLRDGALGD